MAGTSALFIWRQLGKIVGIQAFASDLRRQNMTNAFDWTTAVALDSDPLFYTLRRESSPWARQAGFEVLLQQPPQLRAENCICASLCPLDLLTSCTQVGCSNRSIFRQFHFKDLGPTRTDTVRTAVFLTPITLSPRAVARAGHQRAPRRTG